MKFIILPLTKKERGAKTYPTSKTSILKLLKNCHWLLIFTNYHFYYLWSDPDENLKNKNWF